MQVVDISQGESPIILAQPHGGTCIPDDMMARLTPLGLGLSDTDWHINQLYDGLLENVTTVSATFHRYIIDANRDPSGVSLYPGQNTTHLCPVTDFDGKPLWLDGQNPSADEIETRREQHHAPYHQALQSEIDRVKAKHGFAILYDCHSIRSNIPYLFEGQLPIFSIGTNEGATCASDIEQAVLAICQNAKEYDHVINGRFKGGWTTRHYGQPNDNVHAIQMELAQRCYMDEQAPWRYRDDLARNIRPYLKQILQRVQLAFG